jgi:hypothetical protein
MGERDHRVGGIEGCPSRGVGERGRGGGGRPELTRPKFKGLAIVNHCSLFNVNNQMTLISSAIKFNKIETRTMNFDCVISFYFLSLIKDHTVAPAEVTLATLGTTAHLFPHI